VKDGSACISVPVLTCVNADLGWWYTCWGAQAHDVELSAPSSFSVTSLSSPGLTTLFNALEMPVTVVPMGLDADGLPSGVQIVAGPGEDALSIAAAVALEEAAGTAFGVGWIPPHISSVGGGFADHAPEEGVGFSLVHQSR
jgi:Asp-tRNA(Asn)/Glu-tRNA(Gln) amidotransferase A subunit family amidase